MWAVFQNHLHVTWAILTNTVGKFNSSQLLKKEQPQIPRAVSLLFRGDPLPSQNSGLVGNLQFHFPAIFFLAGFFPLSMGKNYIIILTGMLKLCQFQHPCMIKSFYHFRNRNKQQKILNIKLAKDLEDSYASPLHHHH